MIYCTLFSLYVLQLPNPDVPMKQLKLFYNYLNVGMLLFYFIDLKRGIESEWHQQFNDICFWVVIINYILIILNHHELLNDPITKFWCFNGSVIITSLMILISGGRHNEFNS
jgi:hypothetical protein